MSNFENLPIFGSTELPDCRCGSAMRLSAAKSMGEAEVHCFNCDSCGHELQVAVWRDAIFEPLEKGSI